MDVKTISKANILGGQELITDMILVSQTKDEVQIMDSDTYKIQVLKKLIAKYTKQEANLFDNEKLNDVEIVEVIIKKITGKRNFLNKLL